MAEQPKPDLTAGGRWPWRRLERRSTQFVERLSFLLVVVSSIGAMIVLIDPVITLNLQSGTIIKVGGTGFSDQLKGAVISLILVSGFAAVIAYWLGASNQGVKAQDSVNTIATAAAPSTAAAVAAATAQPVPPGTGAIATEHVDVTAQTATLTETGDQNATPKPKE